MSLHGVIDDAEIERMRVEREAALAVTRAAMGRKHLLHPANRVRKEATKPFLSQAQCDTLNSMLPPGVVVFGKQAIRRQK